MVNKKIKNNTEEEWDEDHALDMVLNNMVSDISDEELNNFLETVDQTGPWGEEHDKIYTVGGLTNDKESGFVDFQKKQDDFNNSQFVFWDEMWNKSVEK